MLHELETGLDIHADNAIRFFDAGQYERGSKEFKKVRTAAKTMSFRLLYGGSAEGFYRDQRMPDYSLKRWREIVNAFYAKPHVDTYVILLDVCLRLMKKYVTVLNPLMSSR